MKSFPAVSTATYRYEYVDSTPGLRPLDSEARQRTAMSGRIGEKTSGGQASGQGVPFLPADYPTDDAVAVMVAAAVAGLARIGSEGAIVGEPERDPREDTLWKFSGRWWAAPMVLRRSRPIR